MKTQDELYDLADKIQDALEALPAGAYPPSRIAHKAKITTYEAQEACTLWGRSERGSGMKCECGSEDLCIAYRVPVYDQRTIRARYGSGDRERVYVYHVEPETKGEKR